MKKGGDIGETIGHFIGDLIGWIIYMTFAAGAYFIGYWLAQYFGGSEHRDAFGILSAIVIIWMYEHRHADERWQRLLERLDNSAA